MRPMFSLAALLVGGSIMAQPAAEELQVGNSAPRLAVKEFFKGAPVKSFEKGKLYVVELWATWCGACPRTYPHLSKLQHKYPDIVFIGVGLDVDDTAVKRYLKKWGKVMEYRVAISENGEKTKVGPGADMLHTWLAAAGQASVPTAFIVDKAGKIAWIGDPEGLGRPLQEITKGKWDLTTHAKMHDETGVQERRRARLLAKMVAALSWGDASQLLQAVDAWRGHFQDHPGIVSRWRIQALAGIRDRQGEALESAKDYVDKVLKEHKDSRKQAKALSMLVHNVVHPQSVRIQACPKMLRFALETAVRAHDLSQGEDVEDVESGLAEAYFANGDVMKAIETLERSIKLVTNGPPRHNEENKELKRGLEQKLQRYRQSLKRK